VQIGKRWLVDGALVNPVPVSAARALDARVVIAVNLNVDLVGRGATIAGYGLEEEAPPAPQQADDDRTWRRRINIERLLRRQVLGGVGRPGLPTVMIEAYNVMQDRITRARLGGDPPDVMISPRLGKIGLFDFHCAEEAMRLGAQAAERSLQGISEAIEALRDPV
jgi:NTE family protein